MEHEPRKRTVDQVADRLRREILDGDYRPGTLLPAERSLAEELDVNRLTLRAAYAQLEAEGLLRARQGQGVVVLDYRDHGSLELLAHLELPGLEDDALALRRTVLAELVAQAAKRSTFEDLADLDDRDRALHQPELSDDLFLAAHTSFLYRLVKAAGSLPLRLVFSGLERWLDAQPGLRAALMHDRQAIIATQSALLNLVRSGDAGIARKAVPKATERIEAAALARHRQAKAAEPEPAEEPEQSEEPEPAEDPDASLMVDHKAMDVDDFSHDALPGEGEE